MKISYNWLKQYVDVKLSPDELKKLFTMSGLSVDSVECAGADHLFEIEVTSNRPDWLSVIGVARELAALTGAKLKLPAVPAPGKAAGKKDAALSIEINDAKLCQTYTGRIIRGVTIGGSPAWLAERLTAVGLRPINNVVDITNFCLFETGEPMHAFDLDKIKGGAVIVRKARKGEKLVTLDGATRELDETMIVIADAERPIALAGIMGGRDTEVTSATQNILLEAASFDPIAIRRASRKFALSTESSYRFERKVAIQNIRYSSDRAAALIIELAGGEKGALLTAGVQPKSGKAVTMRLAKLGELLGVTIPPAKVKSIVTALGMKVRSASKGALTLEVPDFRNDLTVEADIIEEVARIYGYERVPETLPVIVDQPTRIEKSRIVHERIRSALVSQGGYEIITYSLLGKKLLTAAARPADDIVEIRNPLSAEQEVMRSHLLPGALNAVAWNINRKAKDLKLFELGSIYIKEGADRFAERSCLGITLTGELDAGWASPARPVTFYDLKGLVETVLHDLGIGAYSFAPAADPSFAGSECASVTVDGTIVGVIGEVASGVARAFDVKDKVYFGQIMVDALSAAARLKKMFAPIPRFPSVSRDISILAGKEILHADLTSCIRQTAGAILKRVGLIDRYIGKQVPDGKVSLTYRLEYQDPARTLEEKDVQGVHTRVLAELEARYGAKLR